MADRDESDIELDWGMLVRLAFGAALVVAATAGVVYADYRAAVQEPVLEEGASRAVTIPEGASWSDVHGILRREGLVEHPIYFEIWARSRGLAREIAAGTHHFEGPVAMAELGRALTSGGAPDDIEVTFEEGLTIFEMADRVEEAGLANREQFLGAVRDSELLDQAGIEADSFEGYLFPDTYRFRADAAPEAVVWKLYENWRRVWEELSASHPNAMRRLGEAHGLDRHGVVTLASIVEVETSIAEERPLVARVMLNRLDASMRLQADPTCVYGPERYDQVPRPELCDDPANDYSTYVIDGLPPGPIGNPGRRSQEAVLDPADGEEAASYLFYCARRDGTGRHVFSESYEEHKRAVRKHLK